MKHINFLKYYISAVLFCAVFTACERDNYDEPDCTITGAIYDHLGQPFQVNQGAGIIRYRELTWAKDGTTYTSNRTLNVQQDGTYQHTKMFKGNYLLLPYAGGFFPYDDEYGDSDEAGEYVEIKSKATQDFVVTPYLTIEWVQKPTVDAEGYLNCSVKFKRNQKAGYDMPDLRQASLSVSRSINAGAGEGNYFPSPKTITNDMEGTTIEFRTNIPLKYTGINYWIRVSMNCQTAAGNPSTNYPGMGASNFTTIEQIFVP